MSCSFPPGRLAFPSAVLAFTGVNSGEMEVAQGDIMKLIGDAKGSLTFLEGLILRG